MFPHMYKVKSETEFALSVCDQELTSRSRSLVPVAGPARRSVSSRRPETTSAAPVTRRTSWGARRPPPSGSSRWPRRRASVPCAATTPRATTTGCGPAKDARPSLRGAFKVGTTFYTKKTKTIFHKFRFVNTILSRIPMVRLAGGHGTFYRDFFDLDCKLELFTWIYKVNPFLVFGVLRLTITGLL